MYDEIHDKTWTGRRWWIEGKVFFNYNFDAIFIRTFIIYSRLHGAIAWREFSLV